MRAALGWLAVMLVTAVVGPMVAYRAAAASDYFLDPRNQYDAAYGWTLPIHVVQAAHPGWPVLVTVWAMLTLFGFAGWRLAAALARAGATPATIILCYALVAVPLSFSAIIQSVDVYYYIAFARIYGVHGLNPYAQASPIDVSADPSLAQVLRYVKNPPYNDPYGALWTLLAGLLAKAQTGVSLYWQAWSQRAIAVVAGALALWGIAHGLRSERSSGGKEGSASAALPPARRLGIAAFQPLFLYETAVGAHNEMLMVASAVWAFALVDELPLIAALLMGASIAFKYMSLVALPFLVWRAGKQSRVAGAIALIVALGVPTLCFKPFWIGGGALNAVAGHINALGMSPTWLLVEPLLRAGLGTTLWPRAIQLALVACFVAVTIWSLARFARDGRRAHVWRSLSAFLWASPIIQPWYQELLWPAVAGKGRWALYAWWFCALIPLRYALETVSGVAASVLICLTVIILAAPILAARLLPVWSGLDGPASARDQV